MLNELRAVGFNIVTGYYNKKSPNISWKQYQTKFVPQIVFNDMIHNRDEGIYCLITGRISNVVVVDVDSPDVYNTFFKKYENKTVVVATPSGGRHLWFRMIEYPKNSTGYNGFPIDIRAEGGISIVPPSVSDKGEYTFINKHDLKPMYIENLNDILCDIPNNRSVTDQVKRFYKALNKEGFTISKIMRKLGIDDIESGSHGNYKCECMFHKSATPHKALEIYDSTNSYYCHGCSATGDIISMVCKIKDLNFNKAVQLLEDNTKIKANIDFDVEIIPSEYPDSIIYDISRSKNLSTSAIKVILKSDFKFKVTVGDMIGMYDLALANLPLEEMSQRKKQCMALQQVHDECRTIVIEQIVSDTGDKDNKITAKQIIDEMSEIWYWCEDEIMHLPLMVKDGVSIDFIDKLDQKLAAYSNNTYGIPAISPTHIKQVLLDRCENNRVKTYIRTSYIDNKIYYKLNDINIVVADKNGWKIMRNQNDLVFRNIGITDQVIPKRGNKSLYELFVKSRLSKYEKILYMGAHVAAIVESIDHPIIDIIGDPGSGKSAEAKNMISVVDPDGNSELNIWTTKEDFVQSIEKRSVMGLDNLSYLTLEQSNTFCLVVTGGSIEKRVLYTNNTMLSVPIRATLIITSIEDVLKEVDVLDRCIHLNIIKEDKKAGSFKFDPKVIPYKLGAILDCLVYYLNVKDEYKKTIISPIRLDDFYYVTLATAINNGFSKDDVDEAFNLNQMKNINQIIGSSKIGNYIIENVTESSPFEGNMQMLNDIMGVEMFGKPPYKTVQNVSSALSKVMPGLFELGYDKISVGSRRHFKLVKKHQNIVGGFDSLDAQVGF